MKSKKLWITLIIVVALFAVGFFFRDEIMQRLPGQTGPALATGQQSQFQPGQFAENANGEAPALQTTTIRPATDSGQVSAAGNIDVVSRQPAVLGVEGTVNAVNVAVGDLVSAGDVLISLDTLDLERAVAEAELNLQSAQNQLDKLSETTSDYEIAAAEASLASAQQNLIKVQEGPSEAEIAAAKANLASAQAKYQDLLAEPSEAELTQLSANLEKAFIALEQAQGAYDRIAYGDSAGSSPQAASLQQATIDYEAAKAAYEIATEPASQSDIQSALSAIKNAQNQLDDLLNQPTDAELASAMAQVVNAESQLEKLQEGPSQSDLKAAEISVAQAQLKLDEAKNNLDKAQLRAPIAGTALSVAVDLGQKVNAGLSAVTLADLNQLELTVNVAEVDISKIRPGQPALITIDALSDETFNGEVTAIAPASDSTQGVVNYPVTIRLTDSNLAGIKPGMTAVATILDDQFEGGWLVPTSAIRDRNGNTMVMVINNGQPTPIQVTTGAVQGEWTIVQSADLHEGDEVVGSVSSFINQNEGGFGGGGFRVPGGGPPGGGGRQ